MTNCIEIKNHTKQKIKIVTKYSSAAPKPHEELTVTIAPTEYYVIFMDHVESITWTKPTV